MTAHRNRGFETARADINRDWATAHGATPRLRLPNGPNHVYRLGAFHDRPDMPAGEPGVLLYPDILDGTAHLDHACRVLRDRALPFIARRIPRHRLRDWLARQPPHPAPAPCVTRS